MMFDMDVLKVKIRQARAAKLVEELEKSGLEDIDLDGMVHDAASHIASAVNNSGMEEQNLFLLENGHTEKSIRAELE